MTTAAKVIPDRLRGNPKNFVFLDINVDSDFDKETFIDLIFSFRHNYTLRYITLVRTSQEEADGKPLVQRSEKELRILVKEILRLPKLEMLDFENFDDEEVDSFDDLLQTGQRVQQ